MPYAWIIIIALVWVFNAVTKAKGGARTRQRPGQPGAQPQAQALVQAKAAAAQKPQAEKPQAEKKADFPARPALHEAKPLEAHMHSSAPVMGLEGVGIEGEDCCHEYMLETPNEEPNAAFPAETDPEEAERARMLLQGVIFSEVLGRRRPVRRYGGKRA